MNAPAVLSLRRLSGRLQPWPVRPLALVDLLADRDGFKRFRTLVRALFPEQAAPILSATPQHDQTPKEAIINAFLRRMAERYFPLGEFWDDGEASYSDFLEEVPLDADSWDDERLHEVASLPSAAARLLVGLLAPFLAEQIGGGVLEDVLADLCGPDVLRWVPTVRPKDAADWEARVARGPYPAVADMYRWVTKSTGCLFLDYDPEDWGGQTGLEWDQQTVRWLRDQHREADRLKDRIFQLGDWLAERPRTRVAAVLRSVYREEIANDAHEPHPDQLALPVGDPQGPEPGGPAAADAALPPREHRAVGL